MGGFAEDSPDRGDRPAFSYYSEKGVKSTGALDEAPEGFYVYETAARDRLYDSFDYIQEQIESSAINLGDLVIERLFGSASAYYSIVEAFPIGLIEGGLNPEVPFDRNTFAAFASRFSFEEAYRLVYLQDLSYLIESLVETHERAISSLRMALCLLTEIDPIRCESDGVYVVSSTDSHGMMREVESFVIRLYSSLDILSRLLCELQSVPDSFGSFRKISSDKKALYSAYRKRSPYADDKDLVFCAFPEAAYLEDLRNEIVHNRAFESSATCYVRLEEGVAKERFFLLPDSDSNGRIAKWKGRCRFYSQEKKGNRCLPQLYLEITVRIVRSLRRAARDLSDEIEKRQADGRLQEISPHRIEEIEEILASVLSASHLTGEKA